MCIHDEHAHGVTGCRICGCGRTSKRATLDTTLDEALRLAESCSTCKRPVWDGGHALNERECDDEDGEVCQLHATIATLTAECDEARLAKKCVGFERDVARRQRDIAQHEVERLRHELRCDRAPGVIDGVSRIPLDAIDAFIERCTELLDTCETNEEPFVPSAYLDDAIVNLRQVRAEQRVTQVEIERCRLLIETSCALVSQCNTSEPDKARETEAVEAVIAAAVAVAVPAKEPR